MILSIKALGWRGRWIAWRNRTLTSARFQRFAVGFPLTRPVARGHARALFDLVAGFTYSQILAACIETGLLTVLAEGPQTAAVLAPRIDLPVASTERLLRAAAALALVEPIASGWALGGRGAALLGNPGIAEMIAHHKLLYADLANPVELLRRGGGGGKLSRLWQYAESPGAAGDTAAVGAYSALMAASQPMVAAQAVDAYPLDRHRRLLDVGGGEGRFLQTVATRAPNLKLSLFDLPPVAKRARARLDSDMRSRVDIFGGDFFKDPLPPGHDIVTLIRILHDHDDAPALALMRNVYAALPPGGILLISEPMAETPGAEPAGDAYFGFYLLAMGSGRPRSVDTIMAMLREAGFRQARVVRTTMPLVTNVVIGIR